MRKGRAGRILDSLHTEGGRKEERGRVKRDKVQWKEGKKGGHIALCVAHTGETWDKMQS